ncbi:MAG TPA: amidohydrolase [Gemmatimonadaceae bacterium]
MKTIANALLLAIASASAISAQAPSLIITEGKVFTADSAHPWAEAVAIRGDKITAVGTSAEIRRLVGSSTREIRLGGRVVIPGINDAHDHLGDAALGPGFNASASPTPDPAPSVLIDSLRAIAKRTKAGSWIRTQIGPRALNDPTLNRAALDSVAPNNPVILHAWWGHGTILNTAAFRALQLPENVRDPFGGWYTRDANGRLTGRLDEYAAWDAQRRLGSKQPESTLIASLREFSDSSLRFGVTSVQDMAGFMSPSLTARVFRAAQIPLRIRLIRWSIPTATSLNTAEWNSISTNVAPHVTVDGRKWVVDGTPIEQLALRRTPYPGRGAWYGRLDFPADTIRAILASALRPGAPQLHMHIVGDSTTELVLNDMEALAPDSVWRRMRVRIEHGNAITGNQIARAARKGIVIAQPRDDAPWKSWRDAGIVIAYGSDMLRNPFVHMISVVTGGSHPAEAVTREEAVRAYTYGSAYAERREREKGTIAPGMLADIAVLSQDIFVVPPQALPATRSVLTVIGGKIVYSAIK